MKKPIILLLAAFQTVVPFVAEGRETPRQYTFKDTITKVWAKTTWTNLTIEELLQGEFISEEIRAKNISLEGSIIKMDIGEAKVSLSVDANGNVDACSTSEINGLSYTPAEAQVVSTKTNYSNFYDALLAANGKEVRIFSDVELRDSMNTAISLTIPEGIKLTINSDFVFDKIKGKGEVVLNPDVTIAALDGQSAVANPLAGSGNIIVKNPRISYKLAADSSVSILLDSASEGVWVKRILDNEVSFYLRSWSRNENSDIVRGEYTDLFYNLKLSELKNSDVFTLRATLDKGNSSTPFVSDAVFGEIVDLECEVMFPVGDNEFVKLALKQDGPVIKACLSEESEYRIVGIAAAISYEVDGVQSWKTFPEGVAAEDDLILDDSAELTLGFPLLNSIKGSGKVFSAVETTASVKKVILPAGWLESHYTEGGKNGADIGENGVPLWKSYCLGLNPTDSSSLPILSIVRASCPDSLTIVDLNFNPNTLGDVKVTPKLFEGVPGGAFSEVGDDCVSRIDFGFELRLSSASPKVRFFKLKYEFD